MEKKIIILDGNSLLFRAFYAMPPLKTKKGRYTNAVFGFLSMLYKLLDTYSPQYICVAFDPSKPTFRHEQFKEYKAGRAKAPNELVEQFSLIREVLELHNIKYVEIDGFEADDIAGTIALYAVEQGADVYLVTSDKDYLQLIDKNIKVLLTKKGVTNIGEMNVDTFKDSYGINPNEFVDVKALMGDASDNIPGVLGIGEKTALKLIQEYKSIDNLYDNIDNIKGKLKEKLENDKLKAYMSKTLSTIITNIPIEFDLEEYIVVQPNLERLLPLFDELEFRSFKKKFASEKELLDHSTELVSVKHGLEEDLQGNLQISMFSDDNFEDDKKLSLKSELVQEYVCDEERLKQISDSISKASEIAIKFVLDKDRALYGEIIAIGISDCIKDLYYIDCNKIKFLDAISYLKNIFENKNIKKIGHSIKNEIIVLMKHGINLNNVYFDSEIAMYVLNPSENVYSISKLAYDYLDIDIKTENDYLGTGKKRLSFRELEIEDTKEYVYNFLNVVVASKDNITSKINELKMRNLFEEIEMPLIEVLAYMEFVGFKVDIDILNELGKSFITQIMELEKRIYEMSGEEFNINSPKQLGHILFEKMGLPVIKKTKTGVSTDVEVLEKLKDEHEIAQVLIDYRQLVKLNSTYIEGFRNLIDQNTNRIHSIFNQTITSTGRISSMEPNLQNIPVRTKQGRELRKAFVSDEEYILCDADYSQIELRVLAHLANEENLIDAFENNLDIHTKTASEVFHVELDNVTSELRSRAKAVNFGIVYGISDFGLSKDLDIPRKEAKGYIENYLKYYSNIDKYMKDIVEIGKTDGFVTTYFGRRRYIPELASRNFNIRSFGERVALNTPVQGTAADIIKYAMSNVYYRLKDNNMKSRLILQVHDELIVEAHKNEIEEVKQIMKDEMQNVVKDFKVTLLADLNTGKSWYDAK